jgi:hypothetical protein
VGRERQRVQHQAGRDEHEDGPFPAGEAVVAHQHRDIDNVGVGTDPHRVLVTHVNQPGLRGRLDEPHHRGDLAQASL